MQINPSLPAGLVDPRRDAPGLANPATKTDLVPSKPLVPAPPIYPTLQNSIDVLRSLIMLREL